jgi:aarF domain-containing kinase
MSLVKELDFKSEVVNAERTRTLFRDYPHLHIPKNVVALSSNRAIVMEFIEGVKINDIPGLEREFGDPKKPSQILIDIFARMIFNHGHVHCDAHPGNILVRHNPDNPKDPQIVLLDHGFYC